jgi:hypothetical protein
MAVDVAEAEPQAAVGMAVRVAGMAAVLIGTAVAGMVKAVAGIMVVTVAAGELDPR